MLSHFSHVQLFAILWTIASQASLSRAFFRQEYWNGLICPSARDLPDPGIQFASLCLLHWQAVSLPLMPAEKPIIRLAGSDIISKDSKFSYMQKKNLLIQQIFTECVLYLMSSFLLLMLFSHKVMSHYLRSHDFSMSSSPVLHYLPGFAQFHVQWVGGVTQPFHPLPPTSHFAFNLSKHQGLFPGSHHFAAGGQSIRASVSASVFPMNIQGWFPWGLTGLISSQSKRLSLLQYHTIQNHQYFSAQSSLWSNSHICP